MRPHQIRLRRPAGRALGSSGRRRSEDLQARLRPSTTTTSANQPDGSGPTLPLHARARQIETESVPERRPPGRLSTATSGSALPPASAPYRRAWSRSTNDIADQITQRPTILGALGAHEVVAHLLRGGSDTVVDVGADRDLHLRRPLISQDLAAALHEDASPNEVRADDAAAISSARGDAEEVGALLGR